MIHANDSVEEVKNFKFGKVYHIKLCVSRIICIVFRPFLRGFKMYTFTYSNKQKDEFEEVNGCFEQNPKKG